jgi:hypothetical protein
MSRCIQLAGLVAGLSVLTCIPACKTEEPDTAAAPSPELDNLSERDEGASEGGWTQSAYGEMERLPGWQYFWFTHTLSKTSGSATRSGGSCVVIKRLGSATDGQQCLNNLECKGLAKYLYGPNAYGYCHSGTCYARPGGTAGTGLCTTGQGRSPGTIDAYGNIDMTPFLSVPSNSIFITSCMTKDSSATDACSNTDESQYMKLLTPMGVSN